MSLDDEVFIISIPKNPLKLFSNGGRTFCDGLFRMMDQEGFPLADSLIQCRDRGWIPCLEQFVCDAIRAGWTKEKAEAVVQAAKCDARIIKESP